jgi:hypothetical protein
MNHDRRGDRWTRRSLMRGAAIGALGTAVPSAKAIAQSASQPSTVSPVKTSRWRPIWRLERPKPALPNSYFWTWDHSCNWMWDDPGMLNQGCDNRYLKQPETFLVDYERLTDLAAGLGIRGFIVWGFLRDVHGGVESAKRVADYAASKSIAVMPGVGTNWYGGVYYEGNHPYNIETFVRKHPEARIVDANGQPSGRGICATHPAFLDWMQQGVRWLFEELKVGGANFENGDFMVCHCPRCREAKANWPKGDPDFWGFQYLGYKPALEAVANESKSRMITWATYSGFTSAAMRCPRPMITQLPVGAMAQWTLTGMVRAKSLPLTMYLDNGAPDEALQSPGWPAGTKPLTQRNVGFVHQGSQWANPPRYEQVVGTIKEACLCAYRCGLEGVSIHGEVSSMHVPWALNYLAFSHFVHWPEDSMRQFGAKTLGQVFNSEEEGTAFAELFAHWDAGTLSEKQRKEIDQRKNRWSSSASAGSGLDHWRFWNWLNQVSQGVPDRQTVSVF